MKHLIPILIVTILFSLVGCNEDNQFVNPFAPKPGPVALSVDVEKPEDRAVLAGDEASMIVEFHSSDGIGRATITARNGNWPGALTLQFNTKAMERFEMRSEKHYVEGFLGGVDRVTLYELDSTGKPDPQAMPGEVAMPIRQEDGIVHVRVPPELLEGDTLKIQWIDYLRN
jgi:hypothetical protein